LTDFKVTYALKCADESDVNIVAFAVLSDVDIPCISTSAISHLHLEPMSTSENRTRQL